MVLTVSGFVFSVFSALISKLSDRTKAALTVLQGTEDIAVLYSASGVEAATGKGSRVLGKA